MKLTKLQKLARYEAFEEASGHLQLLADSEDSDDERSQRQWVANFLDNLAQKWFEKYNDHLGLKI